MRVFNLAILANSLFFAKNCTHWYLIHCYIHSNNYTKNFKIAKIKNSNDQLNNHYDRSVNYSEANWAMLLYQIHFSQFNFDIILGTPGPLLPSLSLPSSPLPLLLPCIVLLMNNQQTEVARQLHIERHCLLYTTSRWLCARYFNLQLQNPWW